LGLPAQGQLLSISVDALGDDPASLKRWLARFSSTAAPWSAAVPPVAEVDRLVDWLRGKPSKGAHSGQVFLFDREARLRYRTADLPPAREVRSLLHQLASA
jgi:protein SCO1/2